MWTYPIHRLNRIIIIIIIISINCNQNKLNSESLWATTVNKSNEWVWDKGKWFSTISQIKPLDIFTIIHNAYVLCDGYTVCLSVYIYMLYVSLFSFVFWNAIHRGYPGYKRWIENMCVIRTKAKRLNAFTLIWYIHQD